MGPSGKNWNVDLRSQKQVEEGLVPVSYREERRKFRANFGKLQVCTHTEHRIEK